MTEPPGLLERLRDNRPTGRDLAYVDYRLGVATDPVELKVLRRLRARMIMVSAPDQTKL